MLTVCVGCDTHGTINGLWFYDQADCERMAGQLNRLVADRDGALRVSQTPVRPSSATAAAGGGGVLGLLSKAQSEYGKTTTSSVPNVVRPKAVKASGAPAPQEHGPMPAMLQKLFSEKKPEQPTVTSSVTPAVRKGTLSAEELEKELQSKPVDAAAFAKSTPMRLDSIPVTFELGGPSGSASP
uniref:Uncharacterized protein n=1 Tax=Plectus sambesii TaxID=2011161 RepID=A0A914V204_9BILA